MPDGARIGEGPVAGPQSVKLRRQGIVRVAQHRRCSPPTGRSPSRMDPRAEGRGQLRHRQSDRPGQPVPRLGARDRRPRPTLRVAPQSNRTLTIRSGIDDRLRPDTWVARRRHIRRQPRTRKGFSLYRRRQVRDGRRPFRPGDHPRRLPHICSAAHRRRRPPQVFRRRRDRGPASLHARTYRRGDRRSSRSWPVIDSARRSRRASLSSERERCAARRTSSSRVRRLPGPASTSTRHCRTSARQSQDAALSLTSRTSVRTKPFANILNRGMYDQPRRKGGAGRPVRPSANAGRSSRETASVWRSGSSTKQPTDVAGDCQSVLAGSVRHRSRQDSRRLRLAGRSARRIPSCSTGWQWSFANRDGT